MLLDISECISNFKLRNEWIYRGEGNCNVVLSLPKYRKILRIRKFDRPKTLIERFIIWISNFLHLYYGKNVKEELRDLKFYSFIMRPLIGRKYTSEANQVILSRKQVKSLENELNNYRLGGTNVLGYQTIQINSIKKLHRHILADEVDIMKRWKEYFQELLGEELNEIQELNNNEIKEREKIKQ